MIKLTQKNLKLINFIKDNKHSKHPVFFMSLNPSLGSSKVTQSRHRTALATFSKSLSFIIILYEKNCHFVKTFTTDNNIKIMKILLAQIAFFLIILSSVFSNNSNTYFKPRNEQPNEEVTQRVQPARFARSKITQNRKCIFFMGKLFFFFTSEEILSFVKIS